MANSTFSEYTDTLTAFEQGDPKTTRQICADLVARDYIGPLTGQAPQEG